MLRKPKIVVTRFQCKCGTGEYCHEHRAYHLRKEARAVIRRREVIKYHGPSGRREDEQ